MRPPSYFTLPAWSSSRWTGLSQNTFSRLKTPPYARTPSKTALPTAPTQVLPRCTLKLPAQAHWPQLAALQVLQWHAAHRGR